MGHASVGFDWLRPLADVKSGESPSPSITHD